MRGERDVLEKGDYVMREYVCVCVCAWKEVWEGDRCKLVGEVESTVGRSCRGMGGLGRVVIRAGRFVGRRGALPGRGVGVGGFPPPPTSPDSPLNR